MEGKINDHKMTPGCCILNLGQTVTSVSLGMPFIAGTFLEVIIQKWMRGWVSWGERPSESGHDITQWGMQYLWVIGLQSQGLGVFHVKCILPKTSRCGVVLWGSTGRSNRLRVSVLHPCHHHHSGQIHELDKIFELSFLKTLTELIVLGLSRGMQDLHCVMWDLCVHGLSSCGTQA